VKTPDKTISKTIQRYQQIFFISLKCFYRRSMDTRKPNVPGIPNPNINAAMGRPLFSTAGGSLKSIVSKGGGGVNVARRVGVGINE
jgi:hypothetical protein